MNGTNIVDAGAVWVLFGSASGLTGSGSRYFDQETSPISGDSIEASDRFGEVLATAPSFRSDVHDSLLIGTPREDGLWADEGAIFWVGQYSGGTLNVAYRYDQSDYYSACGELGETNDFFGAALAGDYRWSDAAFPDFDWLVGAPGESLTSPSNGRLGVDYHSSATRQCWDQSSSGVLGSAEVDDFFSSALAAGDFDDDGDSDLAIGVPGETLAGGYEGVVQVLYNNGSVLTSNLDQMFDQDDFAPNSSAETGDWFGDPLVVGDFDGDGAADLVIGVPLEGVVVSGSSRSAAGEVNVLYGGAGVGLSTAGKQTFHQNFPASMLGTPSTNDKFGFALAAGDFDGNGSDDLAIGVPNDTTGGISQAGSGAGGLRPRRRPRRLRHRAVRVERRELQRERWRHRGHPDPLGERGRRRHGRSLAIGRHGDPGHRLLLHRGIRDLECRRRRLRDLLLLDHPGHARRAERDDRLRALEPDRRHRDRQPLDVHRDDRRRRRRRHAAVQRLRPSRRWRATARR